MGCKYLTHEENRRKEEREGEREKEEGEGCQSAVASVTAVVRRWYPGGLRIAGKLRSDYFFYQIKDGCFSISINF